MTSTLKEPPLQNAQRLFKVALLGNPNAGKTTLFNALTGLNQRTGNFPGVTVDKKSGAMSDSIEVIDLPGTYSLAGRSPDELISVQLLLGELADQRPDLAVVVADACHFKRSCYLISQVMELGVPVMVAVNMMDLAQNRGISLNLEGIKKSLGLEVVPTSAKDSKSTTALKSAIETVLKDPKVAQTPWVWPEEFDNTVQKLAEKLALQSALVRRVLIDEGLSSGDLVVQSKGEAALEKIVSARKTLQAAGHSLARIEAETRHGWIEKNIASAITSTGQTHKFSEALDALVLNRVLGPIIFFTLMTFVFMSIFEWAGPIMEMIDGGVGSIGEMAGAALQAAGLGGGPLESLVVQGIIAGVGGVLVFVPQIALLFLFLAILEDCGYMARAAFIMDRMLRFTGLSGHSFVPLMSSFACAIPGIMATRTISNRAERLATILVAPLMSCSARIPVYTVLIAAFVPNTHVLGFLSLQALTFTGMYILGILCAIPIALVTKKLSGELNQSSFLMELPTYKVPSARTVFLRVFEASKAFIVKAGTVIFIASVIIWALSYFPRSESIAVQHQTMRTKAESTYKGKDLKAEIQKINQREAGAYLRGSYLGQIGQTIEPVVKPLGWDWSIGIAVLASFPAREVVISVFGIVYDLGEDLDTGEEEGSKALTAKLHSAKWPDGKKVFNLPVALSILVFFALCMQCAATVATIKQETNSWKWPLLSFFGMTSLAYLGALLAYQVGMAMGLGGVS
jgi:ferrous iron transport protein B